MFSCDSFPFSTAKQRLARICNNSTGAFEVDFILYEHIYIYFSETISHEFGVLRNFDPEPYIDMQKMFDAGVWQGHKVSVMNNQFIRTSFRLARFEKI
jgi:hypothetical protein